MRESIGGAWLFGIVIVFIFFFSGYLAYSISYTKAFNVKNKIISYIEENEGYSISASSSLASLPDNELVKSVEGKSYKLIRDTGYNYTAVQGKQCEGDYNYITEGGYCIVKYCPNPSDKVSNTHYKVTTYIALKIPIIEIVAKIPISGETRTIYSDTWDYPCTTGLDE